MKYCRGGGFDRGRRDGGGGRDGGRDSRDGGRGGFRRDGGGRGMYDHFDAADRRAPRHQGGGFTHGNTPPLTLSSTQFTLLLLNTLRRLAGFVSQRDERPSKC